MKHTSHSVIKSYLRNTTNNTFLHIILLLLEHIPLIITSMNAPLKLKYFFSNDITTPLHNVYTHPLLTFFPFRCPNPNITSTLTLTLFILLSFFLLFYHVFISIRASTFQFIFTNFYDLVYFRYGSFYPISIYFTLIFSTHEHSHYVVITILTLFILLWYLFETYIHITSTFTLIRITNHQLCQQSLAYPFDYFVSTKASMLTLALKLFVAAEYVLYTSRNHTIDIIQLGLNVVIIVLFLIEVITVVYIYMFNISVKYLLNDNLLNMVRVCFVLYTFFNIVLFMLFINHKSQYVFMCVVSVVALFWGICVTCYIWYKRAKPLLMDGVFTQDKILYALLNGDGIVKDGKSKVRICSVPALKIVNSMQYYHFTHCGENPLVCKVCKLFNEETQVMKDGSNDEATNNVNANANAHLMKYEQLIKIYKVLFRNQKWKIFQQQRHKRKDKRNTSQLFNSNNTFNNTNNTKSAIKDEHNHKDIFYQFNLYLLLLTYFIKKKDFKFLYLYNYSLSRIRKDLIPHLNVFCEFFMEQNSSPENNIFFYIHATSTVNKDLTDTLVLINDFISLPNEMKYFSHFFKLSQSLKKLSDDLLTLITETESNTDNNIHHKTKKLIISIHKYNLILNRFVVEKLLNKVFIMLSYFDIESLEDIIQLHYSKDKFLMLGMDFKNDPGELIGAKFKVIKCGKEMITYKSHDLLEMFPKIFQIAGLRTFLKLLKQYDQSEMEFDFLYKSSLTLEVEYLKYMFKVSPNLVDHYLFIYGFYISDYKRVMAVLEQDDNDYSLVTISHDMKGVLFLETEWLDVLAMNQKYILLSQIFKTFTKVDDDTNNNASTTSYEGILDYKYYISNMKQYLKVIVEYYEQNNKSKELLNKTVEKLHSRSNLSVKFKFSFLFDIKQGKNRKCKIFSISLSNRRTTQGKDLFDTFHYEDSTVKRDTKSETNQYVKKYETAVNSVSSQTLTRGNSQSGGSSLKGRLGSMMNLISDEQNAANDNKLRKIQKIFSIFSLVIIILNIIIILLCIVFLVVAITSAHRLTTINKLYFKFKDVRIFFNHNFLTIFANACICPSIECNEKCYMNFNRFWSKLSTAYQLDPSLNLRTYLLAELTPKVDSLQTTFEEFLQDVYALNDDKLLTTVTNTLEYQIMNIINNKIETNVIHINFNEGIKRVIASMTALAYDQNESFTRPIAILNYTLNGNYFLSLSETYIEKITDVEKELYSLVANYINYSFAYEKGELEIENAYRQLSKRTKQILISFMIAIIICNILLCCFCCFYIFIVKEFLINFIFRILTILQNQEFLRFYKEKIDNLLIITRLYEKNPNDLIKQIKKIELVQLKQLKANIANKKKMAIRSKHTSDKNELSTPLALDGGSDSNSFNNNNSSSVHNVSTALLFNEQQHHHNNNNNTSNEFTNTTLSDLTSSTSNMNNQSTDPSACGNDIVNVLRPFYIKIALLFTLYAVFAIIFDLVLVIIYEQYLLINDYAIENSKIANQIFANLVLIELSILINITKGDFNDFFGTSSYSEDGYINQKIRNVYTQIFDNKHIQQNNPSIIANTQKFFDYNCDTLFTQINDSITSEVSAITKVNYDKLFAALCDYYHILSLSDFDYLFNSLNQLTQKVANGINKYTYEDLYRIHNEHNLEELYVLMLGLFRPIQLYLREKIINKKLFDTVDLFLGLVWSYLCFNIVVDVVMFIYLKIYIINQLIDMNHNLNLLSGCFYDLH